MVLKERKDGWMKFLTVDEIKKLQLDILVRFADYCEKNNLCYFLYAGTLLGAVRHKGFIPWDDDIDVIMPRPDYEKFLKMTRETPLSPDLETRSHRTNDNYNATFIKIVDNRTQGHENHLAKEIMSGVWIDVFPVDGVPNGEEAKNQFLAKMQKNIRRLEYSSRPLLFCKNPLRFAKRLAIYLGYHHFGYKKMAVEIEQEARKYPFENSKQAGVTVFCGGYNEVVDHSVFEESVKLPFEGYEFNAPKQYDQYLTTIYGDYMTLPPPEQRISAHGYTAWWVEGYEPTEG